MSQHLTEVMDREEILQAGHLACPGCGVTPAYRWTLKVLGRRTMVTAPACCFAVIDGAFPYSASSVPFLHAAFEAAPSYASGVRAALDVLGQKDVNVLVWAGDGGTFDIGMATLSAAAERDEDVLYVCYDNEIYGNTGGQRSSATPQGAVTNTTPRGKTQKKKDIVSILAAHRVPYVASVSLAHPEDALRKMRAALDLEGFRFLHVLAPCPTGWKSEPADGIELIRLAVRSGLFPVREVFDGRRTVINVEPELSIDALRRYFALQGRFKGDGVDVEALAAALRDDWDRLRREAREEPSCATTR